MEVASQGPRGLARLCSGSESYLRTEGGDTANN